MVPEETEYRGEGVVKGVPRCDADGPGRTGEEGVSNVRRSSKRGSARPPVVEGYVSGGAGETRGRETVTQGLEGPKKSG